ncbi:MAG: L-threonylcarbamoyladenylate synthase [Pyrinomonadaceae bacterium]
MILKDGEVTQIEAARTISSGGIVAFRTDTFYGLGADPFDQQAIQKIKALKGREDRKPILVLISDNEQLDRLVPERSAAFDLLKKRFWPGPLTIIGRASEKLPYELTAGTKTVGVRLPDDDKVRALVRRCGGALTATSANPAGMPPAKTAGEVQTSFGDLIEMIIDGGPSKTDQPSTVVDATGEEVKLVREGIIPWSEIQSVLSRV